MDKLLGRYVAFVIRRPWTVVAIFLALTATAALVGTRLRLDTDFASLLPDDLPCVVESRRVGQLVGSTDLLIVAVESPSPADNKAFVDEVAKRLQALPELEWVSVQEDKSYFRDRRLFFLDVPDLETVVERARARVAYEKKIANPFYVSFDDERPPSLEFDDLLEKYRGRYAAQGGDAGLLDGKPAATGDAARPAVDLTDYHASPDGTIMSVVARPRRQATDMTFGRALVGKAEGIIAAANPHRVPGMRAEVSGAYRNRAREYDHVVHDVFSSTAFSLALVLVILVAYFRKLRSVVLVFVPLVVGMTLTVGLTTVMLGHLNLTTALIFAVLLGLGIDFGVHLSVRYFEERAAGHDLSRALTEALVKLGRAMATAGLTTAAALLVLVSARFKGFSEFGQIATAGIIVSMVTFALLLPALVVIFDRRWPITYKPRAVDAAGTPAGRFWSPRLVGLGLGAVALVTVVALVYGAPRLAFEYDFSKLRGQKTATTIRYNKSIGGASSPCVALTASTEQARRLTRHLEREIATDPEKGLLKRAFSIFSFVPEEQAAKQRLLGELKGIVDEALALDRLGAKTRRKLEDLARWTGSAPVSVETLPEWVQGKFREKDGTLGRVVYIYPRINEWQVLETGRFYDRYGVIPLGPGESVRVAASAFILVEVVRAVQRDGWLMSLAACLAVLAILYADLRSVRRALLVATPLLVGLSWMVGLLALLDFKLGLYNMMVLPALLGIGIDASVYLFHAHRDFGAGSLHRVLRTTGGAVVVASLTTAVGFMGSLTATHAGLQTIGWLALVGIGACLAAALLVTPLLLALLENRDRR